MNREIHFAKILPRMARMTRISLEQKGTKKTKEEELHFVPFVCFCRDSLQLGALVENSESVKSVKSLSAVLSAILSAVGQAKVEVSTTAEALAKADAVKFL